jgi:zinc protease
VPDAVPAGRLPAFERAQLVSGATLIVARRPAAPLVDVRLLLDAGFASDDPGRPGLAKLAADMLDEGTATRSALQIGEELQRLGATLDASTDLDTTYLNLSATPSSLDAALAILADTVVAPSFPASEFERVRAQQLAAIDQEGVEPLTLAQRVVPPLLYGRRHPYGASLTGSGTTAAVASMTRDALAEWHRRWVRPGSATIVVVGDVTLADMQRRLDTRLAAWGDGAAPAKNVPPSSSVAAPGLYLLDRPGAPQSVILAAQLMPPRANPQAIPQQVLNAVFGGEFTARLNMNLREDKHWAYMSYAFLPDARAARPLIAFTPVQTDRTADAMRELLKEFSGIGGDRPPTDEEVRRARDALTLPLAGRWETVRAVSESIGEIVRFGLPDDYYATFADRVRATTREEVAAAGRLIDPAQLVWVVAGDRAVIEPGLRGLGLGEIRIIDADGNVR